MSKESVLLSTIEKIAHLGSYEVDLTSGYWTGSDNFIQIFQLPVKERYTQKEFQALVHPEDHDEVMAYFAKCLQNQEDFNYEYRCVLPKGNIIYVLSRSSISYAEDGTPLKVIGVKQDITYRKKAEMHIHTLNELNKRKTQVMGMVAHDLRSPLSQILGLAELMLDQNENNEQIEYLNLISEACLTSNDIITDLIDISELDHSGKNLNRLMYNVNELIQASIQRHRLKLDKKGQSVETHLTEPAQAFVDKSKFSRLIDNLLINAIKFSAKGETIIVRTEQIDSSLLIKIEDRGIGIQQEHIPMLFEDDKSSIQRIGTDGERSTGLGLTIVKQIVDMHDGEIQVDSKENEGTVFTITLHNKPVQIA